MSAKGDELKLRYARYCAWCQVIGVEPAEFERWRSTTEKLLDMNGHVRSGYHESALM
jgi:hypothetical protein